MKVGIYTNLYRDIDAKQSLYFVGLLKKKGIQYLVCDNAKEYFTDNILPIEQVAKESDIMVVFGGDGTMLSVARVTMEYNTPLLGINMGNLGFLTECEGENNLEWVVEKLHVGDYVIEERSALKVICKNIEFTAINEVSLSRVRTEHAIDVEIYVDDKMCDVVTGDGVIVCSPTGSTAYAMSCGGAILSPKLSAMEITAICPHSLHSRPIVVSDSSIVKLNVTRAKEQSVSLVVDGKHSITIGNNDFALVTRSDYVCKLVRLSGDNFYSKLIRKMSNWNSLDRRNN